MSTISPTRASAVARRASNGRLVHVAARVGLTARGVIYVLIGWVALMLAFGKTKAEADQQGALQTLVGKPYGRDALWAIAIGFAAYALWRLSEAIFGVTGDSEGAGPRLKSLFRAIAYGVLTATALSVIKGTSKTQAGKQEEWSAKAMRHPDGRWAVGIVGAIVVIVGAVLVLEGIRGKFKKYLVMDHTSHTTRRTVERLGTIGTIARGLIFALAGALVIDAAANYKPAKAGGLDVALRTLRDQPYGKAALVTAALGLIIFGIYGLCEARWRKV